MNFEKHIQTQDIELRFPAIDMARDLSDLVCRNQEEFKYINYTKTLTDIQKCEEALKSMAERFEKGEGHYGYMIFKDNILVGYAGIKIRPGEHVAEMSYYLDKQHTGNGYVSKAIKALEDIFFAQGGHRSEIFCNETNENSCKVAKRLVPTTLTNNFLASEIFNVISPLAPIFPSKNSV